jgi:cell division protease FtsH
MNSGIKAMVFWLVIMVSAFLLWQVVRSSPNQQTTQEISYSEFLSQVEAGNVTKVTISKSQVYGRARDNSSFRVTAPTNQEGMLLTLRQKNVEIWFKDTASVDRSTWLLNLAPLFLLAALWFVMIRKMRSRQVQTSADGATQNHEKTTWPSR